MTEQYCDLIREVFLLPLRSATIIDDQYPRLEDWLGGKAALHNDGASIVGGDEAMWESIEVVKKRVQELRKHALIVDIHNGKTESNNNLRYHHSDLLILDYQLNGNGDDGSDAMNIAHELLNETDHFNMIILHTQSDSLIDPFMHLFSKLQTPISDKFKHLADDGDEIISEKKISEELSLAFSYQHYALFRKYCIKKFIDFLFRQEYLNQHQSLQSFRDMINRHGLKQGDVKKIIASQIVQLEKVYKDRFAEKMSQGLSWSVGNQMWIKTNRGFIAFVSKSTDKELLDELLDSLKDWAPNPSRLLSAKIRNLLREQGSQLEDHILSDKHTGWLFYKRFIKEDGEQANSILCSELHRQMESYSDNITDKIIEFGIKIKNADTPPDEGGHTHNTKTYGDEFMNPSSDKLAFDRYNSYISFKKTVGSHLCPGHILFDDKDFWMIVSPSCDLVPGQKNASSKTKNYMKFTAARLFKESNTINGRQNAATGNFIFMKDHEGKITAYSVYPPVKSATLSERYLSYQTWLAFDEGRYQTENDSKFIKAFSESQNNEGNLVHDEMKFTLHHQQLRYEYALNYLSKVGAHSSRIGLDFLSHDN